MNEVHFKLDSITRITLIKRKPSEYYWADARPEKRGFFSLIVLQKALPAGWACSDDDRDELSDILCYTWYGFDEAKNEIYYKPHIIIRLLEKGEISQFFESDEEAGRWIDSIISQSKHEFIIIGI